MVGKKVVYCRDCKHLIDGVLCGATKIGRGNWYSAEYGIAEDLNKDNDCKNHK